MSDDKFTPESTRLTAGILLSGGASLCAGFVLIPFVLPALEFTDAHPAFATSVLEAGCAGLIGITLMLGVRIRHFAVQNGRMRTALHNMSQGLCMFDSEERLVFCNRRYKQLYDLPDSIGPGSTLVELTHGIAFGRHDFAGQAIRLGERAAGIVHKFRLNLPPTVLKLNAIRWRQ